MAIHPQSCESAMSNLELFTVPSTHISTEASRYIEHKPVSTLDKGSDLHFKIKADESEYLDFSQSLLHLKCKILATDGGVLRRKVADDDPTVPDRSIVFPVNYLIAAMFKQVEVYLGGRLVSSNDTMYPYRAFLEMLLSYTKDVKNEFLAMSLYFPETKDLEAIAPVALADTSNVNPSAVTRFNKTKFGKSFELIGRIHADFFNQARYLMGKCSVKVKLHRHSPKFFLMAATENNEYILEIESASFFVKHDTIIPSIRAAHLKNLQSDRIKYPIKRVEMKYFTKGANRDDLSERNLCDGQLPTRIVLGMVNSSAFNGNIKQNPFNFQHFNVRSIVLRVNGKAVPFEELEMDFSSGKYLMGYLLLFQGTDTVYSNNSMGVTTENYKNSHTIYAFDLETNSVPGEMTLIKNGEVGVEIKLSEACTTAVTLVAYFEYQDMIEIDSEMNPATEV